MAVSGDATTDRSGGPPSATGRFARWLSGWRVAIRIARRDARRNRWRSALIVAMVGLPVLLLTSGIALMATTDVSMAESVPRVMGSAQARIYINGPGRQVQSPDSQFNRNLSAVVLAVPGFAPDSAWTMSKVQKVTGGRVIQMLDGWLRVTMGDRRPTMVVLGIDARDPLARGMTELVSGRWASTASEVVVTEAGIAGGLPREGTLTTTGAEGGPRQLSVVGVATGQTGPGPPFLVALPGLVTAVGDQSRMSLAFLVGRTDPVTWADVRRLNDYGLLVQSRQVFLNPPPQAELDPQIAQMVGSTQRGQDLFLLIAAVGIFIETTLLAGPAFAVSAARQRHSLALAASNGAEARQLRRYVLGQAVVLGVVSAAVAVVAGLLLTLAGLTWWQAGHADFATGPFEVSWLRVLGVFTCAVVASVVAALLPAKGIARLDIVSVLAGRTGDHRVHRGLPIAGVVVMALSGTGLIWSAAALGKAGLGTQAPLIVLGAVGLVLGCLMVIPAVLSFVGRLGTRLVLPLRLAARDTARQRGRSTPAVAAIMAAVAALTALSISAASYTQHGQDTYQPQQPMGSGAIFLDGKDSSQRDVRAVLNRFAPQLEVDPVDFVYSNAAAMADSGKVPWANLVPPGCTEAQILAGLPASRDIAPTRCESLTNQGRIHVGSLSSYPAVLHLSMSQRAVLEGGGMLITDPKLVADGQVRFVSGTATLGASDVIAGYAITRRTDIPALVVDRQVWATAFYGEPDGAWILPDTAKRLGWPVRTQALNLTSPTGTISPQIERAVADRLGDGTFFQVERGYQNPFTLILLIAFLVAGLLVLIASLISTALSLAESQNDMATLAAVGATRHTRRGIAASQALVVAACGALLGVAVGMIPGIASTWPLTARGSLPPTIAIPWLPLIAVCVGVPLLAAGLAWIAVRRHPQMTRRLA
ncbi:MAG: FtsX-like permease family protein [Dermatophilaceae bacterium]